MIFNYISAHPGASFGVIKKFFDMHHSTLKYHLNYLERTKKIISRREGRRRCYYSTEHGASKISLPIIPRADINSLSKIQRVLIDIIQERPGITKDALIRLSNINRKNLNYNLRKLGELKFVWVVKKEGIIGYEYITREKLRDEMMHRLIMKLVANEIDEETYLKIRKKMENIDIEKLIE
jgi:predicted transcriptional regulator